MILVDANLLLYAKFTDLPQHERAATWLEQVVRDGVRVGLPWASLLAFVRIGTNPRVFSRPLLVAQAWAQVEEWLALPRAWIPAPTDQHAQILGQVLIKANASGDLVSDAHVAALSIEHGLEICSTDADYARFAGVRWRNPLATEVREPGAAYRRGRRKGQARAA